MNIGAEGEGMLRVGGGVCGVTGGMMWIGGRWRGA